MVIEISSQYRIRTVPLNFILEKFTTKTNRKTGLAYQEWDMVGYYPGFQSAIRAIPDDVLLDPHVTDVQAATARLLAVAKEFETRMRK